MNNKEGRIAGRSGTPISFQVENLRRGEFGVIEERDGYILEKRRDPANGLTYYMVCDKDRTNLWSDEDRPWDFRRAVKIFNDLGSGIETLPGEEEAFSFL